MATEPVASEREDVGGRLDGSPSPRQPRWHVLWTRSHCEGAVSDQLAARGFHPFVPTVATWSRRRGRRHQIPVPMFPGYVFLHDALGKQGHVEARKARGVVSILGDGWERPGVVPDHEMEAIRKLAESCQTTQAHPYLREGQRARIVDGPLRDVEGYLVQVKAARGLLVLSIELLQRSVAVEVDCASVVPA